MKIVLTRRFETELDHQFEQGIVQFGQSVAQRSFSRVQAFLFQFLAAYPRIGRYHQDRDVYEVWISKTPFVVFDRIDEPGETLTLLALFHHAQDRQDFE